MRIALVSHRFKRGDGQGRVNLEIAQEALRRGWQVCLVATEVCPELLAHPGVSWIPVPVTGWPTELLRNQVFALRSAIWLRRHRATLDVLLVNGFITWVASDFNASHFVHASWQRSPHRSLEGGSPLRRLYQWAYTALNTHLERSAYLRATRVVAVSARIRRELIAIGVPHSRILVIDNGVDTREFFPGVAERSRLGLPADPPVGLFVGDLQLSRKNLHTVLQALPGCPGLHLAVVGRVGNSLYPQMADRLGVADRVHFLGYRRDVPELMRSVDFVVFPSLYEPSGLVLLEAMASGVPVITTPDVGGVEASGTQGVVTVDNAEDADQMSAAMRSLVADPVERQRSGAAGRVRALELDFRSMAARYCDAFSAPVLSRRSDPCATGIVTSGRHPSSATHHLARFTVSRLWKPWFVCQPTQLARRALAAVVPAPRGYVPLATSWGARIIADPRRTIGRSIRTTGLYDIAVSEALARLISPGDTVVDAGANIGYMSVLAARAAGPRGSVISFEPHPDLFRTLRENLALDARRVAVAPVACHQLALGATAGVARLKLPADFGANDGTASVVDAGATADDGIEIRIECLDTVLGTQRVAVLKLDVEGYEAQVLRGAGMALAERRITHIVFEDHAVESSDVVRLLKGCGYRILALGWSTSGPVVRPLEEGSLAARYEAPSYIATMDSKDVADRLARRGWRVLRNLGGASLK